ncbi:hypothetical protein ILUMI_21482 [Ignelater luminosus]|uniref:Reverse transcriptase domain-containing protein n=1 Tax=Ignelater luminosus TaxID=2038154 RepID=A0A8K0FXX1_IGNLU|nr:hypothetical protein ILUMI_21482 [Ignelater luminosus]
MIFPLNAVMRVQKSQMLSEKMPQYLGNQIQNESICLLSTKVKNSILEIVRRAKYSILNCTPDVSHTEQISVVLRYVVVNDDDTKKVQIKNIGLQKRYTDVRSNYRNDNSFKEVLAKGIDVDEKLARNLETHTTFIDLKQSNDSIPSTDYGLQCRTTRTCPNMGISIEDNKLFILNFADDQVVVAEDEDDVRYKVRKLNEKYRAWGLTINMEKTEYLTSQCHHGERSFSKLRLIKNYLRSTVLQECFAALAILAIESETLNEIKTEDIIKKFPAVKSRRKI